MSSDASEPVRDRQLFVQWPKGENAKSPNLMDNIQAYGRMCWRLGQELERLGIDGTKWRPITKFDKMTIELFFESTEEAVAFRTTTSLKVLKSDQVVA